MFDGIRKAIVPAREIQRDILKAEKDNIEKKYNLPSATSKTESIITER